MKILILSSRYPPHGVGGAERVASTLAETLLSQGHEPVVLTISVEDGAEAREVGGVRVRSVPLRNVASFSESTPDLLKPLWHAIDSANPLMRPAVAQIIREERPDVVHSHVITGFSPSAWTAAHDCGVPIVHTLHDHYVVCARSTMAIDGVACERRHLECVLLSIPRARAAKYVSAVVGVSDFILARHRAYGAFAETRASVIPNPCHLVGSDTATSFRRRRASDVPLRIGFMATVHRNKGVELVLDATRVLPLAQWSLQIAGTGDPELLQDLRTRYAADNVSFVGRVDPGAFLSAQDVLVVPSLVSEAFGMSAAEALALGIPVAASTRGALPEIVEHGRNGFLFDPDEPGSLARSLRRFVDEPGLATTMEAACRESVASLAPALVTAKYVAVYDSVRRS